jgi:hypothetical protein
MKRILIEKWIAALRSGKYKQARGIMKNADGFCCLGVACELHSGFKWMDALKDNSFFYPPVWLQMDMGLCDSRDIDPNALLEICYEPDWQTLAYYLAYANDTLEWDFDRIASWIEKSILPLTQKKESINEL